MSALSITPSKAMGVPETEPITSLILDGTTATLSTDAPAITTEGMFNYDVIVKPSKALTSLVLRFDVTRESGALIFRRTRYIQPEQLLDKPRNDTDSRRQVKQLTENFTRDLVGLGMPEGSYNISVTVTVATKNEQTTASLRDNLIVYNPQVAPQSVVPIVRINYAPMRNPSGQFVVDPLSGPAQAQTEALIKLCRWAQATDTAHITLVIPPQLAAEWLDISDGYVLAASSDKPIAASSASALHYRKVLETVSRALKTQRVTLAWTGYGDPHLGELRRHQLSASLSNHYRQGYTTLEQVFGVTPAPLTAPSGYTVGSDQLPLLDELNISHIVVSEKTAAKTKSSVINIGSSMTALVVTDKVSKQLGIPQNDTFLQGLFGLRAQNDSQPVLLDLTMNSDRDRTNAFVDQIALIEAQPWLTLANPVSIKPRSENVVSLNAQRVPADETYTKTAWRAIRENYTAASNLALAIEDPTLGNAMLLEALSAQCLSPLEGSSLEQRNQIASQFLSSAQGRVDTLVKGIKLTVAPITLASSSGALPVTITNSTGQILNATLVYEASESVIFGGQTEQMITLPDKDSFFEPKLSLRGSLSSNVTVKVLAGNYVVSQKTVRVSASYTDRIVIVVGVALFGLGLVWFARKRAVGALNQSDTEPITDTYAETDHE